MGKKHKKRGPVVSASVGPVERTFTALEFVDQYEVHDVVEHEGKPFIIVSERQAEITFSDGPELHELGSTSPSPFTSANRQEYNRDLQGLRGLEVFDKMRKSDGAVRGSLRLLKTPVLAARWFVEPASDSAAHKKQAAFVWDCYTKYPTYSMTQTLTETLLMADFGSYMFEKVWKPVDIDGEYRLVISKFAPRHPMDVKEWRFDANGGPNGCAFWPSNMQDLNDEVFIPIQKLLVFSFDMEAGNIEGISALRSAYKHWYYKEQLYKIDAIQKERHGIGIPVIKLPVGFSSRDKDMANNLGRNLRTNERAHVVLPPNWDLFFAKLEGHVVNALESVDHHNKMIRENVLGNWIDESGNSETKMLMFLKATRFIADIICSVHNKHFIPELIDYNFPDANGMYPQLKARRIGEYEDWRQMSFALRNMIGSQVIRPDDDLEVAMRDEMDLPIADPDTAREVATPQAPGQSGRSRQNPNPKVGPPGANSGRDKGGQS